MQNHVLIVDDEKPIRDLICFVLRKPDFHCVQAEDAQTAYTKIRNNPPDIILLDWMLPSMSGLDLLKQLKAQAVYRDIPVLMLSAKAQQENKIKGLNMGCDDYISKPFAVQELIARIRAVLRRSQTQKPDKPVIVGKLQLQPGHHHILIDGHPLPLRPKECRLLKFFMTHTEHTFTRQQLLDYLWSASQADGDLQERTIDVHIRRLRKQLAQHHIAHWLQTVHGIGYRLSAKTISHSNN